jgi:hypothetical protein
MMDGPKHEDACQAACVANTSEGRNVRRHYTLKYNKSDFAYFFFGALAAWRSGTRRNSLAPTRDGLENGSAFACDMRTWVARREAFQGCELTLQQRVELSAAQFDLIRRVLDEH